MKTETHKIEKVVKYVGLPDLLDQVEKMGIDEVIDIASPKESLDIRTVSQIVKAKLFHSTLQSVTVDGGRMEFLLPKVWQKFQETYFAWAPEDANQFDRSELYELFGRLRDGEDPSELGIEIALRKQ